MPQPPPYEPFSLPPSSSKPPASEKPRPSLAARALHSKPGKLTTQVVKGLTIASGVVSLANSVAHVVGNEEAVTVLVQLAQLLHAIARLF